MTTHEPSPSPYLNDRALFSKLWTSPREALSYIHQHKYQKYYTLLLALAGITQSFDRAVSRDLGDKISLLGIVATCIIAGGLLGWISYYIYAALISFTGQWLKGIADTRSIIRVMAYALLPHILTLALLGLQISIYGIDLFQAEGDLTSGGTLANIVFYTSVVAELILGFWSLVLLIIGISVVQKFSIGKAIVNLIFPIIVIAIPVFAFAIIIQLLS